MTYQRDWPRSKPDPALEPLRRRIRENVEDARNAAEYDLHLRDEHEDVGHEVFVARCAFCIRVSAR